MLEAVVHAFALSASGDSCCNFKQPYTHAGKVPQKMTGLRMQKTGTRLIWPACIRWCPFHVQSRPAVKASSQTYTALLASH